MLGDALSLFYLSLLQWFMVRMWLYFKSYLRQTILQNLTNGLETSLDTLQSKTILRYFDQTDRHKLNMIELTDSRQKG